MKKESWLASIIRGERYPYFDPRPDAVARPRWGILNFVMGSCPLRQEAKSQSAALPTAILSKNSSKSDSRITHLRAM